MKIAIGSDHGGYELKGKLIKYIEDLGYEVVDYGTYSDESVDYPDYGEKVAKSVVAGNEDLGVVICGTGIGISIAANKVKGARAALCSDTFSASMARQHNNANIIALGARVTGDELAKAIVKSFLDSSFEGGRHARRVDKIMEIEHR